ncbi:MAG: multicopper oxidase domain-containing protein, partial [Xanthobacteraceae bacterium]
MQSWIRNRLNRRGVLSGGVVAAGGAVLAAVTGDKGAGAQGGHPGHGTPATQHPHYSPTGDAAPHTRAHGPMISVGDVDNARNGFDPSALLTDWETGEVSRLPDGRTLRTFEIAAEDKEIEIAPGVMFPAWTFNGRVPGPTLRATEGERLRIVFQNYSAHPHTMHFHGIHAARMDGIPGAGEVLPGGEFIYEFDALPFGCHLFHCHWLPLKRHIHKGMYAAFIIDPAPERHPEHA